METVAVIGASPKQDRYSNKALRMLSQYNHNPIPVAPKHETIEGLKVYHSLDDVPDGLDTVTVYLGPKRQSDEIVRQIINKAPRRVIFNPDTENKETADKLKTAGIEVVEACTLVMLRTNQF